MALGTELGSTAPALLCLHQTGASSAEWRPLGEALGGRARLLAPDRLGWAEAELPEGYRATTIHEQAEDAASRLSGPGNRPAIACGAGIGAAIALDLLLGHPELVSGAVLIEPPLLAFSTAA
ncbi:MAG: alpha/beta fold hydrolase, partial [Solirubrobacterales bacterium]